MVVMTRKHYEMIAEAIKQATKESFFMLIDDDNKEQGKHFVLETLTNIIFEVSKTLKDDNPNFDMQKFTEACMVSSR